MMADNKRTKLEKTIEVLDTRQKVKTAQLMDTQRAQAAICEDLATESDAAKWEQLVMMHTQTGAKAAALQDELAVLAGRLKAARLALNDYDLVVVDAEVTGLLTENQGIRAKANALRDEFRRLCAKTHTDIETKQRTLDVKTELAQLDLAGGLTMQQITAAKRRRADLLETREGIN